MNKAPEFVYDVFLSHSSADKPTVRELAERLRGDGVRVWFDEWEIRPGDSIAAKIETGLEHARVLVLCMSAHAFGSDWAQLEAGTFRFRDPLNRERRFIPLRLDDAPIKGSLAQFLYINWRPEDREQEYPKLLEACRGNVDLNCTKKPSAFVPTSAWATRIVNPLQYYLYVSRSKIEMLYAQLASIGGYNVQDNDSAMYSKLAAVVSSLRKEPGIIALPSQEPSMQTGYYEDTDRWNIAVLDNSDTDRQDFGTAFCMYKDEGNSLTLLFGSPGNMIGSFGDQSRHSISPSWATDKYLLALVQSLERHSDASSQATALEGSLDKVLYFAGYVCAYMPRMAVNVLFRNLYTYHLNAAIWATLFAYAPYGIFVDTAEHLIIGSPICVALADNADVHAKP